jgi:hypothetical protein
MKRFGTMILRSSFRQEDSAYVSLKHTTTGEEGEKNLLHPDQIRRMEIGYIVPRIILVIRSTEMEKYYRSFLIGYKLLKSKLLKIMPIILYKSYGSSSFKPMLAGWSLCLKHDVQLMSQVLMHPHRSSPTTSSSICGPEIFVFC